MRVRRKSRWQLSKAHSRRAEDRIRLAKDFAAVTTGGRRASAVRNQEGMNSARSIPSGTSPRRAARSLRVIDVIYPEPGLVKFLRGFPTPIACIPYLVHWGAVGCPFLLFILNGSRTDELHWTERMPWPASFSRNVGGLTTFSSVNFALSRRA
jgi:hypothetical protein